MDARDEIIRDLRREVSMIGEALRELRDTVERVSDGLEEEMPQTASVLRKAARKLLERRAS